MTQPIDFFFDFSSPYSYLASLRIEQVFEGLDVDIRWRPFLLGAVFKITGNSPQTSQMMKGDYMFADVRRTARRYGVPFEAPENFPFGTVTSSRAFYFVAESDPVGAVRLAKALLNAAFQQGRDICPVEAVAAVGESAGFDGAALLDGMKSPQARERLKEAVDAAIAHQVFGVPYFVVGDQGFWGNDRLEDVAEWVRTGGW